MTLKQRLKEDVVAHMKAGNKVELTTVRNILGEIGTREKSGKTPVDMDEAQVTTLLQKEAAKRRDTARKTRTPKVVTDAKGKVMIEDLETFKRHLYSHANGDFPMVATGREKDVIAKELAQPGLFGWYRNPSSGAGGLSSRIEGSVDKSLFPDFLFFYLVDGEIAVDIVDPHNHSPGDTPGKWAALSRFARQNPGASAGSAPSSRTRPGC